MIRIDAMWLAVQPVDMRSGSERLLAQVVQVFGVAQAHHGYLFANARGTRLKLLVHDGFGIWCAARRLNQRRFLWATQGVSGGVLTQMTLAQFWGVSDGDTITLLDAAKSQYKIRLVGIDGYALR